MPTRILTTKDINGKVIASNRGRQFSDLVYSVTLTASTAQVVSVPLGAYVAFFNFSKATPVDVFVGYNGGVIPSGVGDILLEDAFKILLEDADDLLLEGSGFFSFGLAMNPDVRWVRPGDQFALYCTSNTTMSIEFYSLSSGGFPT